MNQHGPLSLPRPASTSQSQPYPSMKSPPMRHPNTVKLVHIIHALGLLSLEFQLCPRTPPHTRKVSHLEKKVELCFVFCFISAFLFLVSVMAFQHLLLCVLGAIKHTKEWMVRKKMWTTNCNISPFYSPSPLPEDGWLACCGTGKADGYVRQEQEECLQIEATWGKCGGETPVSPGERAGER